MVVLPFQTAQERVEAAELRAEAEAVISRLGAGAGWFVGATARSKQVTPELRKRLLAIEGEIESIQRYDWFFPEDHSEMGPTALASAPFGSSGRSRDGSSGTGAAGE